MEVKGATLLYTLAGLMITFAGFSALLLAVRPASGAKLSLLDRYLAKTVMTHIFVLTAAALLPYRRRRMVGKGPPFPIFAVFVVFGSAVTLAMLVYVLSGLKYSAAAYITALAIDFFTVAFAFMVALDVIMKQPMEVPERKGLD